MGLSRDEGVGAFRRNGVWIVAAERAVDSCLGNGSISGSRSAWSWRIGSSGRHVAVSAKRRDDFWEATSGGGGTVSPERVDAPSWLLCCGSEQVPKSGKVRSRERERESGTVRSGLIREETQDGRGCPRDSRSPSSVPGAPVGLAADLRP